MSIDAKKLEKAIYWVRNNAGLRDLNALSIEYLDIMAAAAEAHLATLPKQKEVWRVEYARKSGGEPYWTPLVCGGFESKKSAEEEAERLSHMAGYACICVTGPHTQTVPA